jgi:hypothetical protein
MFLQEKTQGEGGAGGWEPRGSVKAVDKPLTRVVCRGRHAVCWREVRNARFEVEAGWCVQMRRSLREVSWNRFTRARLEVEQSRALLERAEQRILVEVREAVRSVETNIKRTSMRRGARELAQKKLEAGEKKLAVGLSSCARSCASKTTSPLNKAAKFEP